MLNVHRSVPIVPVEHAAELTSSVERVRTILGACTVQRPAARVLGRSFASAQLWAAASRDVEVPPIVEYRIREPLIVDDGVVLLENCVLAESIWDYKAGIYRALTIGSTVEFTGTAVEKQVSGLLMKKRGQTNYGHWLVEVLPRHYVTGCSYPLLVHGPGRGYEWLSIMFSSTLRTLDPTAIIHPLHRMAQRVPFAHFLTGVSKLQSFFHPCIADMSHRIRSNVGAVRGSKKLFVTRAPAAGRGISNADDVYGFFLEQGFDIIDAGALSFEEQIVAFSQASEVFGIMGAAMCNCIFASKSARVGFLAPSYMNGHFYLDMETAMQRAKLEILFCDSLSKGPAVLQDDIWVDLDQLKRFYFDG